MEWKERDESQSLLQWRNLLATLKQALISNHHNQLLFPLQDCIKLLFQSKVNLLSDDIKSDLTLLLDACKRLDEIAQEKDYREMLAHFVIEPLLKYLRKKSLKDLVILAEAYIRQNISYGPYGEVMHSALCDHLLTPMELHHRYVSYLQTTPEQYDQVAIVIRVIDYWRQQKNYDPQAFIQSDIAPLQRLGEQLFLIVQNIECQPRKKAALWRLILLLQILLVDHPSFERKSIGSNCTLLDDYQSELTRSREVFSQKELDVLDAQREHSVRVMTMLHKMVQSVISVLGKAPCDVAVCVLGSTSRYDRRPYSDLELMILHSKSNEDLDIKQLGKWQSQVDNYIHYLVSILELIIVRIGETHNLLKGGNAGFHLDSSCHILMKKTWGTPREIIERFINVRSQGALTHPWLDSEVLYALLQPTLINSAECGADALMKDYQDQLRAYLIADIAEEDQMYIINQRFRLEKNNNWYNGLTRQQGIAMVCLHDVVQKSIYALNDFVSGQDVNIKEVYYKPLLYFALNLRLFFDRSLVSPIEIIKQYALEIGWYGETFVSWWHGAFTHVVQLQIKMHLDAGHQEESVKYPVNWSVLELHYWSGLDLIIQGFIQPLHSMLNQWFVNKQQFFRDFITNHTQHSFNVRQLWINKWSPRSMDVIVLMSHPLLNVFTRRETVKRLLEILKASAQTSSYTISLSIINASIEYLRKNENIVGYDAVINFVLILYFKHQTEYEPLLTELIWLPNLEDFATFLDLVDCSDDIFIQITKYLLNTSAKDKLSCRERAYRWYQICESINRQNNAMLIQTDSYGFRLKEVVLKERLEEGICALESNESTDVTLSDDVLEVVLVRRTNIREQRIRLNHAIVEKIINLNTGHIQHHSSLEKSPEAFEHRAVNFIDFHGFKLHFKEHPDFPLMAVFNYLLHMRIMGTGSIPVEIVLFQVKINNKELIYPVLVSLTVPGNTLKQSLTQIPQLTLSHTATASCMVMDAIKHAGDGFPRNYIVSGEGVDQEITCVDTEQSFVTSYSEGGVIARQKVQEISIFYCLSEFHSGGAMFHSLPQEIIKLLAEINVKELLEDCLNELASREELDKLLYGKYLVSFVNRNKHHPYIGECLLAEGLIGKLTVDLQTLKTMAERALKKEVTLTAQGVLAICAGQKCANLFFSNKGNSTPSEHLQRIAGRTNTLSSSDYSRLYLGGQVSSFDTLSKKQYNIEEAKKEISRCQYIHFSTVKELGGAIFSPFEKEKTLLLDFTNSNDPIVRQQLYRLISSQVCFIQLIIKSCQALTDDLLMQLLDNSRNTLQLLDLQDLPNITEKTLFYLADKFPKLAVLFISVIGATSIYRRISTIIFKELHFLAINQCSKLSWLVVDAPNLAYFECKDNQSLLGFSAKVPKLLTLRLNSMLSVNSFNMTINQDCDIRRFEVSKTCKTKITLINSTGIAQKISGIDKLFSIVEKVDMIRILPHVASSEKTNKIEEFSSTRPSDYLLDSSQLDTINIIIVGNELAPVDFNKVISSKYQKKRVNVHLIASHQSVPSSVFGGINIAIIIYEPGKQDTNYQLTHLIKNIQQQSYHPIPVLLFATKKGDLDIDIGYLYSHFPDNDESYKREIISVAKNFSVTAMLFHDIIFRQVNTEFFEIKKPFVLPKGFKLLHYNYIMCSTLCLGHNNDKTDHTSRYNSGVYTHTDALIGMAFFDKMYSLNKINFKIRYWECAMNERYALNAKMHYNTTSLVLILETLNDIEEYNKSKIAPFWFRDFKQNGDSSVPCVLIGINAEQPGRKISYYDAKNYAKSQGFDAYFECDAKTGRGINEAFEGSLEYFIVHSGFWRWAVLPYELSQHVIEGIISNITVKFEPPKTVLKSPSSSSDAVEAIGSKAKSATLEEVDHLKKIGLFSPGEVRKSTSKESKINIDERVNEEKNV